MRFLIQESTHILACMSSGELATRAKHMLSRWEKLMQLVSLERSAASGSPSSIFVVKPFWTFFTLCVDCFGVRFLLRQSSVFQFHLGTAGMATQEMVDPFDMVHWSIFEVI